MRDTVLRPHARQYMKHKFAMMPDPSLGEFVVARQNAEVQRWLAIVRVERSCEEIVSSPFQMLKLRGQDCRFCSSSTIVVYFIGSAAPAPLIATRL